MKGAGEGAEGVARSCCPAAEVLECAHTGALAKCYLFAAGKRMRVALPAEHHTEDHKTHILARSAVPRQEASPTEGTALACP